MPPGCFYDFIGLVDRSRSFRCQLRILDLLHPLIADPGQPALKRFGLGGGDGLDDAEKTFGIGAVCFPHFPVWRWQFELSTNCRQFKAILALNPYFHFKPVIARIYTIRQNFHNINNGKPLLVIMKCLSYTLAAKNCDFGFHLALLMGLHGSPRIRVR